MEPLSLCLVAVDVLEVLVRQVLEEVNALEDYIKEHVGFVELELEEVAEAILVNAVLN